MLVSQNYTDPDTTYFLWPYSFSTFFTDQEARWRGEQMPGEIEVRL